LTGFGYDDAGRGNHKMTVGSPFDGRAIQDDRIEIRADVCPLGGGFTASGLCLNPVIRVHDHVAVGADLDLDALSLLCSGPSRQ
jgi:hypothetical protein